MVLTNLPRRRARVFHRRPGPTCRKLPYQVFLIVHETCELHLIDPEQFLVMPDFDASKCFLHFNFKYHTRWFRDGLASYAGTRPAKVSVAS